MGPSPAVALGDEGAHAGLEATAVEPTTDHEVGGDGRRVELEEATRRSRPVAVDPGRAEPGGEPAEVLGGRGDDGRAPAGQGRAQVGGDRVGQLGAVVAEHDRVGGPVVVGQKGHRRSRSLVVFRPFLYPTARRLIARRAQRCPEVQARKSSSSIVFTIEDSGIPASAAWSHPWATQES